MKVSALHTQIIIFVLIIINNDIILGVPNPCTSEFKRSLELNQIGDCPVSNQLIDEIKPKSQIIYNFNSTTKSVGSSCLKSITRYYMDSESLFVSGIYLNFVSSAIWIEFDNNDNDTNEIKQYYLNGNDEIRKRQHQLNQYVST